MRPKRGRAQLHRCDDRKVERDPSVLAQRLEFCKTLYDHETGSKANYLEMLQSFLEQQKEIEVQKSHLQEAQAALAAVIQTRFQTVAEYRRARFAELVEAESKANGFKEDLIKAQQKTKLQQLTAPVDGTVQQLAVHTVGGVVTPAQILLVVVPAESELQIEAMVSNRDIGFVHEGQEAQIKVDTFNFTRYGLVHGKVMSVSRDAITRDKPRDTSNRQAQGAETESSEPKGQEMNYVARVSLDHTQMQVDRPNCRPEPRYGRYGRDHDWIAPSDRIPAVAAAPTELRSLSILRQEPQLHRLPMSVCLCDAGR